VVHGGEQMVQVMVAEVGERSKQGAVDSRSLSHRVQLSQTPVPVKSARTQTGPEL
jgi:hypothetical protein